jgi:prepilin-type N-terminal cleavage/methylation domain-containing protein
MKRAFTLIEIIFVVALSALLFLAVISLYQTFTQLYAGADAGYSARTSAGRVVRAVESIVLPADRILTSHAFSTGTYTTGQETLVVEMPSITSAGAIIAGTYDYAVIYQSGTSVLMRTEVGAGSARNARQITLGTEVTNLDFAYDNADVTNAHSVTPTISVLSKESHQQSAVTLTETVRARNLTF